MYGRPAGESDEDSDDDYYGNEPVKRYPARYAYQERDKDAKQVELLFKEAVSKGDLKMVQEYFNTELKRNYNYSFVSGWTPLVHAAFYAQKEIVNYLVTCGADPNLHADSITPLMSACSSTSTHEEDILAVISILLKNNAVINIGDKYGQTPLMKAIKCHHTAGVQELLKENVNIEMRDTEGWTSLYWAVYSNDLETVKCLVGHGARLSEVDKHNRTPLDVAVENDYTDIAEYLEAQIKPKETAAREIIHFDMTEGALAWHDMFPGILDNDRPAYANEIPNLLYGMQCEVLIPLFVNSKMDLRTFLLLEENDMIALGIDLPYLRRRLKLGIHKFHTRPYKISSVPGLSNKKMSRFEVVECLNNLGINMRHVYILNTSLHYTIRLYNQMRNKLKYEAPQSPLLVDLKKYAEQTALNINGARKEIDITYKLLDKISKDNPPPADLIRAPRAGPSLARYVSKAVIMSSIVTLTFYSVKQFMKFRAIKS